MITLTGNVINDQYKIMNKIAAGNSSDVYWVENMEDSHLYVAKIFKKEKISNRLEDIIRFHSDVSAVMNITSPYILKIHSIGEVVLDNVDTHPIHFVITDHIKGKTLQNLFRLWISFSIEEAIDIVIHMCDALMAAAAKNIYHREIRPANILIPEKNGLNDYNALKLYNFGVSNIRNYNRINQLEEIISVFGYMSPEQTGKLNRIVDERSDLYSLGVIFYYLLTQQLPFRGDNIASILHQHVAKRPDSPSDINSDILDIIDSIVLKLLDKEPENRYQSARGLRSDLKRVKAGETRFILGLDDEVLKLTYRTKLIGRKKQCMQLETMIDHTLKGEGRVCFIRGEAGRGKSRLIEELKEYIYTNGGQIITGNNYSDLKKVPFGPYKEALDMYLTIYDHVPPDTQEKIRKHIKEVLGDRGCILLDFNLNMAKILDESYPPLVKLDAVKEHERFITTLSSFFRELSKIEAFLVIVLDDLHWSDEGCFELLYDIIRDISNYPLLILGLYRDNEVKDGHALLRFKERVKRRGDTFDEIKLPLLNSLQMDQFTSGLFRESKAHIKQISDFLSSKSKGNPLFAIEIAKQLIKEKIVFYRNQRWHFDKTALSQAEVSATIVDVLLKRISDLNPFEQKIISYAAVIGRKFDLYLLFELVDNDKKQVVESLDKAKQLQLLEGDLYEKGMVLFAHDSIKEAFYKKIVPKERAQLHLKIAQKLEERKIKDTGTIIFDLAYHYIEAGHKEKMLDYSFNAGIIAMNHYGHDEALRYFNIALRIIDEKVLKGDENYRDKWIICNEYIGNIYSTIGKNDEAIEHYGLLMTFQVTKYETALNYKRICHAYLQKRNFKSCEEYGKMALKAIGERLSMTRNAVILGLCKELVVRQLHSVFPYVFIKQKPDGDVDKYNLIVDVYQLLGSVYIISDKLKLARILLRGLNLSEKYGAPKQYLANSLASYGGLLMTIPIFKLALKYMEKGHKLGKSLNDERVVSKVNQWLGLYYNWTGEYIIALASLKKALGGFESIGDRAESSMTINGMLDSYYLLGNKTNLIETLEIYANIAQKTGDPWQLGMAFIYQGISQFYIHNDLKAAEHLILKALEIGFKKDIPYILFLAHSNVGQVFAALQNYNDAIMHIENAVVLHEKDKFLKHHAQNVYCELARVYIEEYLYIREGLTEKERKKFLNKIKVACKTALKQNKKWITHYGSALRVMAEYYALVTKNVKSRDYFKRSIDAFSNINRRVEAGVSSYKYGLFLQRIGDGKQAKEQLMAAYNFFKDTDYKFWLAKVEVSLGIEKSTTSIRKLMVKQRLDSITTFAQNINDTSDSDEMLARLMAKAIEISGAQRGYLFVRSPNSQQIVLKASQSILGYDDDNYSNRVIDDTFRRSETIIVANAEAEDAYKGDGLKSIMCLPLKQNERLLGVCYLDNPLSTDVFAAEDAEILRKLMTRAVISIDHSEEFIINFDR